MCKGNALVCPLVPMQNIVPSRDWMTWTNNKRHKARNMYVTLCSNK